MEIIDYLVTAHGVLERGAFYNYIHELGYEDEHYSKEYMIKSLYPFGISINSKTLIVVESATICYYNQINNKIKTVEEIKQILNNNLL